MIQLFTILLSTIIYFPLTFTETPVTFDPTTSIMTVRIDEDVDVIHFISPDADVYTRRTYKYNGKTEAKVYVNEDGYWAYVTNYLSKDQNTRFANITGSHDCDKVHYNQTKYLSRGSCGNFTGIGVHTPENGLNKDIYDWYDVLRQAKQVEASSLYYVLFSGDDPTIDIRQYDKNELKELQNFFTALSKEGIVIHIVLYEAETNHLDGDSTRLKYFNLVSAWFGHLPNVTYILSEEYDNIPIPLEQETMIEWACQLKSMDNVTPIGIHNASNNIASVFYHFHWTTCIDFYAVQYYADDDYGAVVQVLHEMSERGTSIKPVHITEPESFHGYDIFCYDALSALASGAGEFGFYYGKYDQNLPDFTIFYHERCK